ncbi:MAG: hypothetical protein Athens071426_143 [Parcubacteria group bacterium Athens0714_26]|nr:MAG: hypothetical protein Athens071426_143 [Parcubacteria group bacterium Athens0714_26]
MKTIFLPIFNGLRSRNFFRTDIYRELIRDKNIRLVVLAPAHKIDFYKKEFNEPNIIFESWNNATEPFWGKVLHSIAFSLLNTGTIREKQRAVYIKDGNLAKFLVKRSFTVIFGNNKFLRKVIRWLDRFVYLNKEVIFFLNRYKPDLVLVPDIILESDRVILRAAKRKRILTVGMVRSWDNLTAKGVIQVLPDKLISQTTHMKQDIIKYADVLGKDIVILGVAQFDDYYRKRNISREDFLNQLGIPSSRKLVLCAPFFDVYSNKSGILIIKKLVEAVDSGKLPKDIHFLVRYRPESGNASEFDENDIIGPYVTITKPCQNVFKKESRLDFEFSDEDMDLLTNSLYFSDVTINTISTLTVDAAALDKPIINIRFDGDPDCPPWARVKLFSNFDHYKLLEATGGVRLVYSVEELINQINVYLNNPRLDGEGRKKIREQQVEFFDGQSGKRIADYIKKLLETE